MFGATGGLPSGGADDLTIRWRETRLARGRLRLAQRVRSGVTIAALPALLEGLAREAYADEIQVEWPNGNREYVQGEVLLAWARRDRSELPTIPRPEWDADMALASERAQAIDGLRLALARLLACQVIDDGWAEDLVRRVHVAAQALPASSVSAWRS